MDDNPPKVARPRRRIPIIKLPSGEDLVPRSDFAEHEIGVAEKTLKRLNLPTTYVGGKAYVARIASLQIVADSVRRRNQPPQRRRGAR
jgi:hypothetical protein